MVVSLPSFLCIYEPLSFLREVRRLVGDVYSHPIASRGEPCARDGRRGAGGVSTEPIEEEMTVSREAGGSRVTSPGRKPGRRRAGGHFWRAGSFTRDWGGPLRLC